MKNLFLFLLLLSQFGFSQIKSEEVKNYKWDEVPNFKEIPVAFQNYPAVILKDYRLYDNRIGGYAYKAFVVKHQAIKILKEEGINDYNKVTISKKYVRDYRDLKVRVIKSNGKIEELPKERILEKDDSDERQFVFEGVEKGDIIEYYYVIKDYPEFSGTEYFQRDIPLLDGKFQINSISQGQTFIATYNGIEKSYVNGNHICTMTNLPAYKSERNATNIANLAKLYFYVDSNFNYDFDSFYYSLNNFADGVNAKSMVRDFIEEQKLDDTTIPLDERLKKMDIYLKENVELDEQISYRKIFETKKMTPRMVLYLYKDVLDYLKIPYQFIASTDKFEDAFNHSLVVPATLSEIMIYIPETKKYLSPFYYWMPYGPPNSVCIDNEAVFYQKGKKGKVDYTFDKIGGVSMDDNVNITESTITIDDDMETVLVNKKSSFTGYRGFYYRSVIKNIKEDKINEFIKDVVFSESDVEVKKHTFENKEYKFNYDNDKPFTFDSQVQIKESWIENAGKNYLITLGKVLGDQTNLYQETERSNPIVLTYPKKYNHKINFTIPDGYSVASLNNLLFDKEIKNEANETIGKFISTAKIEGNLLRISIEEFYNFTYLGKEKYNDYRDLINTAYDFYKSALVLTKS